MAEQKSFLMYKDQLDAALPLLNMEQRGELLTALFEHFCKRNPEITDSMVQMAYRMMANTMDTNSAKYEKVCSKRAEYGRQGGIASGKARKAKAEANEANEAKANKMKQNQANEADNDTDKDNDTDNDTDKETDTEAQEPRPSGVSLEDRELLDREFGSDRAAELIEEVELWAATSGKTIKDWPSMVRTFAKNQRRWDPGGSRDVGKLVDVAFERWVQEQEGTT